MSFPKSGSFKIYRFFILCRVIITTAFYVLTTSILHFLVISPLRDNLGVEDVFKPRYTLRHKNRRNPLNIKNAFDRVLSGFYRSFKPLRRPDRVHLFPPFIEIAFIGTVSKRSRLSTRVVKRQINTKPHNLSH